MLQPQSISLFAKVRDVGYTKANAVLFLFIKKSSYLGHKEGEVILDGLHLSTCALAGSDNVFLVALTSYNVYTPKFLVCDPLVRRRQMNDV